MSEIVFDIVYWGVGLGGKSTTLQYVYAQIPDARKTKMVSLPTASARQMSFTFLPATLAPIDGRAVRLRLVTFPGAVFHDPSRKDVLAGAQGVVFVVDSQIVRLEANVESREELDAGLAPGASLAVSYNKRDLPSAAPLATLEDALNPRGAPSFETIAHAGTGVFDSLRACIHPLVARTRTIGG